MGVGGLSGRDSAGGKGGNVPLISYDRTGRYACQHCGYTHFQRQVLRSGEERFHCRSCGERVRSTERTQEAWDSMPVCGRCFSRTVQTLQGLCPWCCPTCSDCGNAMRHFETRTGEWVCRSGICGRVDYPGELYGHDFKPKPRYTVARGEKGGRWDQLLYFGVEVEMEFSSTEKRESAVHCAPHGEGVKWFCKTDGSLSCGVEFVSHPATWQAWQREDFGWLPKSATSYNTDSCGIHVHVSRGPLGKLWVYKLLRFFAQNQRYILNVSRRSSGLFNRWASIDAQEDMIRHKAKGGRGDSRYRAVNCEGRNTLEVRIFKGTTRPKSILRIAWIASVVEWTRFESIRNLSPVYLTPPFQQSVLSWSKKCI
jgi:ssDNA-binding Zn-finger/Zn-ribbon topoisomerase 1